MSICITADSAYFDGRTGEFFGRSKYFIFIDPETDAFEIVQNTVACMNNAGVRAAGEVLKHKSSAVVTGRIGKNALKALRKAGIAVLISENTTVREALDRYRAGKLKKLNGD
jgi:predicted Fe-Mo cluster-binding NifX family protein